MKIDQLDTPFLSLYEDGGESVAIHPSSLPTHLPTAKPTGAPAPYKMADFALLEQHERAAYESAGFRSLRGGK